MKGWKELEYNIPTYDKETHRINGYDFEELSNKVVAHAIIVEQVEEEMNELVKAVKEKRITLEQVPKPLLEQVKLKLQEENK